MTALEKGEPPAVIALLSDKSLAEGEELVRTWEKMPPGSVFRDCDQCPEMVVVPSGRFRMGDMNGDGQSDELPVHGVTIAYPFAVGKYEVTFAEWDACVADGGCTNRPDDQGTGRGSRPVLILSWLDTQEYVRWLSRVTGKSYRLLSEAEWEYVARAGSTTKYHWGDYLGTNKANCHLCGSQWDNTITAPVGSFEPNAFGLFDTAGNLFEWVEDCWNDSYRGAPADGSTWTSGDCSERVLRGGAWAVGKFNVRSSDRLSQSVGKAAGWYGFRVARTLF